jgi:hypothetical protein
LCKLLCRPVRQRLWRMSRIRQCLYGLPRDFVILAGRVSSVFAFVSDGIAVAAGWATDPIWAMKRRRVRLRLVPSWRDC